jgi:hypothetical protein
MRVAIARDVIAQLKAGYLQAKSGTWVQDSKLGTLEDFVEFRNDFNKPMDACEFVNNANKCSVCSLGAIFMSSFKLFQPKVMLQDGWEAWAIFEELDQSPLAKYFPVETLGMIEACFEGADGVHDAGTREGIAAAYEKSFKDPTNRLNAIMANIIRNEGQFKPEQDLTKEGAISALVEIFS